MSTLELLMRLFLSDDLYTSIALVSCFDNDLPDDAGNPPAGDPPPDDRRFTQADLNKILAEDKRKHQDQLKKVEKQYQELLQKSNLSAEERMRLEESLEDVRKQVRTKEEQAKLEKRKLEDDYNQRIHELESRVKTSEEKFYDMMVTRSLQDAAVAGDAFNPVTLIAYLKPMVKLVDDKPMIEFPDADADTGESILKQFTPEEAVSRMKELPEKFGNMFKANVVSGVGGNSTTGATPGANGKVDVRKLSMAQYKELRKNNPRSVGLVD
jgi:membrane-bound lytic murein transglycosylase